MIADQTDLFSSEDYEPEPDAVDVSAGALAAHTTMERGSIWIDLGGPIRWLRIGSEDARGLAAKLEQLACEVEKQ